MASATVAAETRQDRRNLHISADSVAPAGTAVQTCSAGQQQPLSRWATSWVADRPVPQLVWRLAGVSPVSAPST
jgi:hypothetical protein